MKIELLDCARGAAVFSTQMSADGYLIGRVESAVGGLASVVVSFTKEEIADGTQMRKFRDSRRNAGAFSLCATNQNYDEFQQDYLFVGPITGRDSFVLDSGSTVYVASYIVNGLQDYCNAFGFTLEVVDNRRSIDTKPKRLEKRNFTFGVEVEAEGADNCTVTAALGSRYGYVHGDGSLSNGIEVSMSPIKANAFDNINKVCASISAAGGSAKSSRCGGHIHIGAKAFKGEQHINLVRKIVHRNSDEFVRISGRKTLSEYAKFSETNTRYSAVNLFSLSVHGTVEFRFWGGTLNADLIAARAKLMAVIVSTTARRWKETTMLNKIVSSDEYKEVSRLTALEMA